MRGHDGGGGHDDGAGDGDGRPSRGTWGVLLATRAMLRPASLLFGLLVAATLLHGVSAKKRNHGGSRTAATRKKECEQSCADADPDDAFMPRENCVQQCLSAECYQQVYAGNELEPGEIDTKRSREFTQCVTKQARNNRAGFGSAGAVPDARDGKAGGSDTGRDSDERESVEL